MQLQPYIRKAFCNLPGFLPLEEEFNQFKSFCVGQQAAQMLSRGPIISAAPLGLFVALTLSQMNLWMQPWIPCLPQCCPHPVYLQKYHFKNNRTHSPQLDDDQGQVLPSSFQKR